MNFKAAHSSIKEIAVKYANTVWNAKEIGIIDQLIHQDVLIHSLLGDFYGRNAMKEVVQSWLKGFPDLCVSNDLIIAENDLVSIQWRAQGTHKYEFKGKKAYRKGGFLHWRNCLSYPKWPNH